MSNDSYPLPGIRRVITGHTSAGEPVVIRDEVTEPKFWAPGSRSGIFDLYRADEVPASNNALQGEWVDLIAQSPVGRAGLVTPNGATFRVFDYAPGSTVVSQHLLSWRLHDTDIDIPIAAHSPH